MQSIPVDTSRLGALMCVVKPEPKIADFESKEVKKDRDGNTIYTVAVTVRQDGRRVSVIEISVTGEPKGVEEGMPVRVTGLEAFSWAMGDRHGISFRAAAIAPVPAPSSSAGGGKAGGA
ncbi:SCO3933 family regulatory protein [Streptomyces sp. 8N616]|uniref:SCO3933 family regulatory protein n=1 Tax=Streptomyces sp. 8N616 TaxID=3457414 RepID=UPI003FD61446